MAAKVVMVAVPTVMGIASIRVYTVSDVPADGLVTREKLNIYSPLPPSAQARFVPERPGVIQSGLTTAREHMRPLVQAVKGACVSVKTRSVNVYYAGEDVYYYLKDPPPGFLPRFGTVTMAGVLGMFLTRKGSHFKRLAVPLGLMSAGASVCYPAQTVAVLKVTGKKVYAVGQWSSAAVSSLLSSKSQDIKDVAASQPQTAAVVDEASEPSSAQSSTIPEREVESAESVVAVITEEASSVEPEIYPDQTPTETNAGPVAHSVPVETTAIATSEEINASVGSEEPSDTKRAAEDISTDASPAEPTPSLEPETLTASPVESVLVEVAAPVEVVPVESVPVEVVPVESVPVESVPVESVPVEVVPVEVAAPVEVVPVESVPVEVVPVEVAAPVEVVPVESVPVESVPVESFPVEVVPVEVAAPVEVVPVESVPVEVVPVEVVPVEVAAPVEVVPVEEPPTPKASNEPTVPVVESAEPEPSVQPELTELPQAAAVDETLTPQLAPGGSKGGSGFKQDPALMDFGQSNPEDEDLYSTRS
ncbi:MICOS complex subunit MIC27 isoform X2 [Cyclopterus lumpus]|uniref:MICOS complex subunit MIC27 isoform X2 n=1 Tax=Cyclopterus lumpus TaxID=8103 RepID=UPI001486A9BC|nr:MICOS complex subunit MIC27 isoform X2 [Cyclopterus lumpus]